MPRTRLNSREPEGDRVRFVYYYRGIPELTQAIHIEALIRELRALNHEVEPCFPLAPSSGGAPSPSMSARALGRLRLSLPGTAWNMMRRCADGFTGRRLRRLIEAARPDAIYERYVFMSGSCARTAQKLGIPHLLEVNETARLSPEAWSRRAREGAYRIEDEVLARSEAVIAVSGALRDHLAQIGVSPEKITVMHNGVHPEDYADLHAQREETRRVYGLNGRFAIGYVQSWQTISSLNAQILDMLGQMARRVFAEEPTAALVVIGGGAAWQEMQDRLLAIVQEPPRFVFTGSVPHSDIPGVLAGLDAGVVAHHEPFTSPLKLFEYMAAGLAVLAPALPNIQEVIRHGETGLTFTAGDAEELAHLLMALARDPYRARALGEAARREALAQYTWRSNAERVARIARDLIARQGR